MALLGLLLDENLSQRNVGVPYGLDVMCGKRRGCSAGDT